MYRHICSEKLKNSSSSKFARRQILFGKELKLFLHRLFSRRSLFHSWHDVLVTEPAAFSVQSEKILYRKLHGIEQEFNSGRIKQLSERHHCAADIVLKIQLYEACKNNRKRKKKRLEQNGSYCLNDKRMNLRSYGKGIKIERKTKEENKYLQLNLNGIDRYTGKRK